MADERPQQTKQALLDAEARAQAGDFSGVPTIVAAIADENPDVRLRAAYIAGRIGSSQAIERLSGMALHDRISPNRNQATYALSAIGRPAVVPALIAALNDADVERRMDARIALYQMLGPDVFEPLVDEDEGAGPDQAEIARVTTWWHVRSARLDPDRVYAFGQLATPGVFVRQLDVATASVPDAYLDALHDWTGQDFGRSPMPRVVAQWRALWKADAARYEPGRRYFYGHPVPSPIT